MGNAVATGQRVRPEAALATGYVFRYPTLDAALAAIYGRGAEPPS
jgi:NAD dependent epimerase/dehydratase family enzyme